MFRRVTNHYEDAVTFDILRIYEDPDVGCTAGRHVTSHSRSNNEPQELTSRATHAIILSVRGTGSSLL